MQEPRSASSQVVREAVPTLIAVNIGVLLLWWIGRQGALEGFLYAHFTTSLDALKAGRIWTLLTAAFSHFELWHLAINMFVLYGFGSALERSWGTRFFWTFYLTAAVASNAFHAVLGATPWWDADVRALGASGAVAALLVYFGFLYPRHTISLFFFIPVPAIGAALAFIAWGFWGLYEQAGGGGGVIAHGAHLGGAFCGLVFYFVHRRPPRVRRQRRVRRRNSSRPTSPAVDDRRRMDELLVKISRGGLDSLSREEREFMIRMSDRIRGRR